MVQAQLHEIDAKALKIATSAELAKKHANDAYK